MNKTSAYNSAEDQIWPSNRFAAEPQAEAVEAHPVDTLALEYIVVTQHIADAAGQFHGRLRLSTFGRQDPF
jgi:hypothetical protein